MIATSTLQTWDQFRSPLPDDPTQAHPSTPLGRTLAAYLASARARYVPEPAELVQLRQDLAAWQAVLDNPDAPALAVFEAQRRLSQHQPRLELLDAQHADVLRAAARECFELSQVWQAARDAYVVDLRKLRQIEQAAWAEVAENRHSHTARHERVVLLARLSARAGSPDLYRRVLEEQSDAAVA